MVSVVEEALIRGRFITFEGTEGAGKSTQIARLAEDLESRGHSVVSVREPGGTPVGERIRDLVKDPSLEGVGPESELLLMCASRSALVRQVISPALEAGKIVLCDRFFDSTFAYQGFGRGLSLDRLHEVNGFATGGLIPDATIFLEIPLDLSLERRRGRDAVSGAEERKDRFEQSGDEFFRKVERGFQTLAAREPERIHRVNGVGSVDEVTERIRQVLFRAVGDL